MKKYKRKQLLLEQNEIVRPRLSQLELFSIMELIDKEYNLHKTVQSQTSYVKHLKRLRRKLKRNLKINYAHYDFTSNRVPYVKAEQPKAETPTETSEQKEWLERRKKRLSSNDMFLAFKY